MSENWQKSEREKEVKSISDQINGKTLFPTVSLNTFIYDGRAAQPVHW